MGPVTLDIRLLGISIYPYFFAYFVYLLALKTTLLPLLSQRKKKKKKEVQMREVSQLPLEDMMIPSKATLLSL